ncbi:MAG: metallophosphoesterase [Solirubrobacteraceae bacterium]|nr:metallophosphoesterase [Solirubrobacteraceae bacterium]
MLHRLRGAAALLAVVAATVGGAVLALETYSQERALSIGTVDLNVDIAHRGALDLYVPLVDWGVRFDAVRLPVRVKLDIRSLNRDVVESAAEGELPAVRDLRDEATDALRSYLLAAIAIAAVASLAAGLMMAFAMRSTHVAPLRRLVITAVIGAVACTAVIALLIPPRGSFEHPEYYANGPDIPVALEALEDLRRSGGVLGDELDQQLVGLARLVQSPGERETLGAGRRFVIASDLHNNVLALPTLERTARGAVVLFAGDLTDRGTPLESTATKRVVGAGSRFVAVAGNHDSDTSMQRLADEGAVVLTRRGRLLPSGRYGQQVVTVGGARIAGYDSPNQRMQADDYADRGADITPVQRQHFSDWLTGLLDETEVDVVMVHEPSLAAEAVADLRREPRVRPPVVVTGHTHRQYAREIKGVLEVNGGTLGAGGTGNLAGPEADALGLAVVRYSVDPFRALAADTVQIDPATGSARAERLRLR